MLFSTIRSTSSTLPTRMASLTVKRDMPTCPSKSLSMPLDLYLLARPKPATTRAKVCLPPRLCELIIHCDHAELMYCSVLTTAIIHAGRISLDEKRSVEITDKGGKWALV